VSLDFGVGSEQKVLVKINLVVQVLFVTFIQVHVLDQVDSFSCALFALSVVVLVQNVIYLLALFGALYEICVSFFVLFERSCKLVL
jgi:hypothetical protein